MILSRHGDRFASETHGIKGLEVKITRKVERLTREDEEDFALVEYRHPENWSGNLFPVNVYIQPNVIVDWVEHGGDRPKNYYQFNIDLNHIEFEHHWLFSQEDTVARRLRNMHTMYVVMSEKLVAMLKEHTELRQRVEIEIVGEDEQIRINGQLAQLKEMIGTLKEEMPKVGTQMEVTYEALKQLWEHSGLNSTNYRLEKYAGTPIEDDSGQEFVLHTYLLKHVHPKEAKKSEDRSPSRATRALSQRRTAQEQLQKLDEERCAAIQKCRIRVQIYFNDILVCKTDEVPLGWNFVAHFSQVYNLKVFKILVEHSLNIFSGLRAPRDNSIGCKREVR